MTMSVKTIRKFKCKDGSSFLTKGKVFEFCKDVIKESTVYIPDYMECCALDEDDFTKFFGDWDKDAIEGVRKFKCLDTEGEGLVNNPLVKGRVFSVTKSAAGPIPYITHYLYTFGGELDKLTQEGFERFFGDWDKDFIAEGTSEWDMGFIAGETVPEYDIGVKDASKEFLSFVTNLRLRLVQGENLTKRLEEKEAELETRIKELS